MHALVRVQEDFPINRPRTVSFRPLELVCFSSDPLKKTADFLFRSLNGGFANETMDGILIGCLWNSTGSRVCTNWFHIHKQTRLASLTAHFKFEENISRIFKSSFAPSNGALFAIFVAFDEEEKTIK